MSRSFMFAGALALIVGGCAFRTKPRASADSHDVRARQAHACQNYELAAAEKQEANRLHAKAAEQRAAEASDGNAVVPRPQAELTSRSFARSAALRGVALADHAGAAHCIWSPDGTGKLPMRPPSDSVPTQRMIGGGDSARPANTSSIPST